jgi:hypothetical protein
MPSLYGNKMVFWGRSEVSSSSLSVTLFRNQAKVTVQNEAANFTVTGYALGNMTTKGTVVPFIPDDSQPVYYSGRYHHITSGHFV